MNKVSKFITLALCVVVYSLSAVVGLTPLNVENARAQAPALYEDSFDYTAFQGESIYSTNVWVAENPSSGNSANFTAQKPIEEDGVLKIKEGASAQFNWTNLDGFTFNKNNTYTLTFDLKVTDFGDNVGIRDVWKREFYFAAGGYYNQIELRNDMGANKSIRTGDSWGGNTGVEYNKNVTYTIVVVWQPSANKITSTLKNGSTVVLSGSRTNSEYGHIIGQCSNWVMRCEDGAVEIDNLTYTDGTNTYTQNFNLAEAGDDVMTGSGIWAIETKPKSDATAPTVENGVVKLTTKDSFQFNWAKVTDYDASKTYTYEFDFKVTSLGTGELWAEDQTSVTRALYVAFGGYWNIIEFYNEKNQIRTGDTYVDFDSSLYFNKTLHAKIVYEGTDITAGIYDQSGKCLTVGNRTNSDFTNMTTDTMKFLVMRCEDGAVEIDNFSFREDVYEETSSTELEIAEGKKAVYSATVKYIEGNKTSVKLNNTEIFAISDSGMKVGGAMVVGEYEEGEYGVSVVVNPQQKMVEVEVELPDGGILRRSTYTLLSYNETEYVINVFALDQTYVTGVEVLSEDVIKNDYSLVTVRPSESGFGENVYNLVTSFNKATSTRNFAFTALTSYVGSDTMAIAYREDGATEWILVDATKQSETASSLEDYYKVDLEGLKPATKYEYQIGKKNSASADDWSKIYSFTTAKENEEEFTFVAVGDTQGITWEGTTSATKGFMFAKSAYDEAMEEVENPAFIMHAGDVVENGNNANQWNMFFDALGEHGAKIPHFATIGNHDAISANGTDFFFDLHFNHPNNGGINALDQSYISQITNVQLKALAKKANETIYSYNYGDAHFVVLNSGHYTSDDRLLLEAQRAWLDADLKANACAKWTVVLVHEPVYHRVGGNESRPWLYDVIEGNDVDLVIQGHSHLVTRTYPMKDGKIVTKESPDLINQGTGTVYTTIGSTAYNHDSLGNPNMEECLTIKTPAPEQAAYTTVTVNGDKLVMTVKQLDGLVLDRFEIVANEQSSHAGEEVLVGKKDANCQEEGYTGDKVCSVCNKIIEKGEPIEKASHEYNEEVADSDYLASEANCTEPAKYYKSCSCGEAGEETFDYGEALGHSLPDLHTCHDRVCSVCEATVEATTQHTWNQGEVTKEPTTEEKGEKTFTCTACGATKTEDIDKLEDGGSQGGGDSGNDGNDGNQGGNDDESEKGSCATVAPTNGGNGFGGGMVILLSMVGFALIALKKKRQ